MINTLYVTRRTTVDQVVVKIYKLCSKLIVEVVVVAHVQETRRAVRLNHLASRARLGIGRPCRSGTLGAWYEAWAILFVGSVRCV